MKQPISETNSNTYQSLALGRHVVAARLGLAKYDPALLAIQSLTLARAVLLVRLNKAHREKHFIIATTADSLEHQIRTRIAVDDALKEYILNGEQLQVVGAAGDWLLISQIEMTSEDMHLLVICSEAEVSRPLVTAIANEVAQCWALGTCGMGTKPEIQRPPHQISTTDQDFFGQNNPFGLTKSEQRVCSYLKEGARPATIADKTGTSISTVRTHLRRIYSKTDCGGMVEVLHLIGANRPQPSKEVQACSWN